MSHRQAEIRAIIEKANATYRYSDKDSGLSDEEYDYLLSLIKDESFKKQVGLEVKKDKVFLPIKMGSLNKIKNFDDVLKWLTSQNIDLNTPFLLTPKFDGLSLLVIITGGKMIQALTRGDGIVGQDVTNYLRATRLSHIVLPSSFNGYLIGEVIMTDKIFADKYKKKFKNPRNMVAGLLSRKEIGEEIKDVSFLAYGVINKGKKQFNKSEEIDFCNKYNNWLYSYKLLYLKSTFEQILENDIQKYFEQEKEYQCDGVVITLDDKVTQNRLGYETGTLNPAWARAWKPESQDIASSEVLAINWQVSKRGYQKPVVKIKPIDLGGVTISNVTGINARFILDNAIGVGSIINIIRAGDVIPKIIKVLLKVEHNLLPTLCSSCSSELEWHENQIELQCFNKKCEGQVISANIDFFKILEIEEVGEGIIVQLCKSGYKTVKNILNLTMEDLLSLDGVQTKKAEKLFQAIHAKLENIPLEKIQHASNLFKGLGSKKLALLNQYDNLLKKPTLDEIIMIEGFSETLSQEYLEKFDEFWDWVAELPITIKPYKEEIKEGPFLGKDFVFSGFKDIILEKQIEKLGGKVKSAVSSKTYALAVKDKNSNSNKIQKAKKLNIQIFNRDDLQKKLNAIFSS